MASSAKQNMVTVLADAAIAKGKAVKAGASANHVQVGAANTDRVIGIAQSASTAAEDAIEVALPGGGAKALLGETVVYGNDLVSHTDGSLVLPNAEGDQIIAQALQAGVAGDLIDVTVYKATAHAAQ